MASPCMKSVTRTPLLSLAAAALHTSTLVKLASASRLGRLSTSPMRLQSWSRRPPERSFQTSFPTDTVQEYPPSETSLKDLKKAFLSEIRGTWSVTRHSGRYLLLRTTGSPEMMVDGGIATWVEDEKTSVRDTKHRVPLALNNIKPKGTHINDFIPKGTILIIKEPFVLPVQGFSGYPGASNRRVAGLRADHLNDVVLVKDAPNELIDIPKKWRSEFLRDMAQTTRKWQEKGVQHFHSQRFREAVGCFTQALKREPVDSSLSQELRLQRMEAYLSLGHHEDALADSSQLRSSMITPDHRLSLLSAQALYQSGRYGESKTQLNELSTGPPNRHIGEGVSDLMLKAQQRMKEEQGVFDFQRMRDAAQKEPLTELDHASYKSSSVVVKSTDDMGRGIFAAKDIKAGELLLCEKAFKVVRGDGKGDESSLSIVDRLLRDCVHEINANPLCGKELLQLTASWKPHRDGNPRQLGNCLQLVDGKPVIDSFHIRRILAHDGFSCENLSAEFRVFNEDEGRGNGIWITGSLFNHSCYPNASQSFIANMMLVRATRNISAGEQLFIQYMHGDMVNTYDERQELFQQKWGFRCQCEICKVEAAEDPEILLERTSIERERLLPLFLELQFRGAMSAHSVQTLLSMLIMVNSLLWHMSETYASSPPPNQYPRLSLAGVYLIKRKICFFLGDESGFFISSLGVLKALGYQIRVTSAGVVIEEHGYCAEYLVNVVSHIAWFMERARSRGEVSFEVAEGWKSVAKHMYRVVVGETASFNHFVALLHEQFDQGNC